MIEVESEKYQELWLGSQLASLEMIQCEELHPLFGLSEVMLRIHF